MHIGLLDILSHTPTWVFVVFGVLAVMGIRQLRASSAHLYRVIGLPLAMVGFAVWGVTSAFGHASAGMTSLLAWAVAGALTLALVLRQPLNPAVRYDAATRRFSQPGSWVPLALMMGIFLTKYVVGVSLALHPEYAHQTTVALGVSTLYGAFSGVFAGRALRLWARAARPHNGLRAA